MRNKIVRKLPGKLLHGADYNPEQWLDYPEILEEDIRLMKKAEVNCVSLGIFSWSQLEREDEIYNFEWMEKIIEKLYKNDIYTILATPTGAIPPWLSSAHEEVLQVNEYGVRNYAGNRHNFCPSSPVMRRKMQEIDSRLSQKFGQHPGVIAWHISNEYGGNGRAADCHCPYCQEEFRKWLKAKYGTLENLNKAWWTTFWSHTYTEWSQIHSPSKRGENVLHGLKLDWKRFVSHQLLDFAKEEIAAVREYSNRPVTTNMMGFFKPLNYFEWGKEFDFISWDNYPDWHSEEDELRIAAETAAAHSLMRGLKKAPFLMMESTPSMVNWRPVNTLKRPGMHALSSLQAIACGSDSVQYFQWRKSRGSCEKFHGAVLDHKNGENTRVFGDVREVGKKLGKISEYVWGTCSHSRIAMIFDWENWWAVEDVCGVEKLDYKNLFCKYFYPFWEMGVDVDIQNMESDFSDYQIIIAPYNYMYQKGYADKIRDFVKNGGCYVTTCWSGEADDTDLCFIQAHPLQDVLGIRTEETDACRAAWDNQVSYCGVSYQVTGLRGIIHRETAEVKAYYEKDFYKGFPALTRNAYGKGCAYYIAAETEIAFLKKFYRNLLEEEGIGEEFAGKLSEGVTVSCRSDEKKKLWFLQNYNRKEAVVILYRKYFDIELQKNVEGTIEMPPFSCYVLLEEPGS
ncbi:MAG TPA: hypothetical protein DCZ40_14220 [Lachnospiraceae bacterium]|nr:hypothetical protein [Lachnospiraceae bacterium]